MLTIKQVKFKMWRLFLFALFAIVLSAIPARSATVTFTFTNSYGVPDTNAFKLFPIAPYINADGSVQTTGLPQLISPNTNGFASVNLLAGNYLATNRFLVQNYNVVGSWGTSQGVLFAVPNSAGTFPFGQLAISGYNVFNYNGAQFTATYSNIVSALGYVPLPPSATNNATQFSTNVFTSATITNGSLIFATNAAGISVAIAIAPQTNGFTSIVYSNASSYSTPSGVTNIVLALATTNGISAATATNIANYVYSNNPSGYLTGIATNPFVGTNFVNTQIQNATNALAYTNQLNSYVLTTSYTSGTNTIATNAASQLIATNALLVASLNSSIAALNASIATSSNLLQNTKQPASLTLSNLAATGAYTNQIIAGANVTLQTNFVNVVTISAPSQTFLTNGYGSIVTHAATDYLTTNNAYLLTNGYGSIVTHAATDYILTNALPALTNGFVTSAITNGLVGASVTNGLATTNYVNAQGFVTASVTNGLATTNFVLSTLIASNANFATYATVIASNTANLVIATNMVIAATNALASTSFVNSAVAPYALSNTIWTALGNTNSAILATVTNLVVASTNSPIFVLTNNARYLASLTNPAQFVASSNGNVTNLTMQGVFVIGTKTNFVYSTNMIGLTAAGSPNVAGTYLGNGGTTWTNVFFTNQTISLSGGNYYAISNATTLYASTNAINWTLVSGSNPTPLGSFGHYIYNNGANYSGWFYSTNITWQMTNNIGLYGYPLNFIQNSNLAYAMIQAYAVAPTNGITATTATNIANGVYSNNPAGYQTAAQVATSILGATNGLLNATNSGLVTSTNLLVVTTTNASGTHYELEYTNAVGGSGTTNFYLSGVITNFTTNTTFSASGTNAINNMVTNLAIANQNGFGTNTTLITGNSIMVTNLLPINIIPTGSNNNLSIGFGNKFPSNASGGYTTNSVCFGISNSISPFTGVTGAGAYSDIVFGGSNNVNSSAYFGIIGNGTGNKLDSHPFETIINGYGNYGHSSYISILNGTNNSINISGDNSLSDYSVILNGDSNLIYSRSDHSLIGVASFSKIAFNNPFSAILSGSNNIVSPLHAGSFDFIPYGKNNSVDGSFSAAIGSNISITNIDSNTTIISDGNPVSATTNNQMILWFTNGVSINTNKPSGFSLNTGGAINATNFYINGVLFTQMVFTGTNTPYGNVTAARGAIYNQFDAVATNTFIGQWINTNGASGWQ